MCTSLVARLRQTAHRIFEGAATGSGISGKNLLICSSCVGNAFGRDGAVRIVFASDGILYR